jgi:hypothetical protein
MRRQETIPEVRDRRVLDIDGDQVTFEITVAQVPVPRPFLSYHFRRGGRLIDGVLAEVTGAPEAIQAHFDDAELARLFRAARRNFERGPRNEWSG